MKRKKLNVKKISVIIGLLIVIVTGVLIFYLFIGGGSNNIVKFDTGEGSSINSQLINKKGEVTRPIDPVREGYSFEGWFVDGEEFDFKQIITGDITLEAKWKKIEEDEEETEEYTIDFDSDGGTQVSSIKVKEGEKAIKPTNPTKDGYSFVSWQLDGKDYDFDLIITKDLELLAKWEKKTTDATTPTVKHRVTFDSAGGSAVSSKLVVKGAAVPKPANPTRSGYKFIGWYLNNALYSFNKGLYDNITLVAKWEQIASNITYSINWVKIESSSIGQYTLYIRSSEGKNVAGKAKITTTGGNTSVYDIPATGKVFIKSSISNATVESVN